MCKNTRHLILPFLSLLMVLSGCASKNSPADGMRVGLHIDAVLEFVIEYPLDWAKDRRLAYGSDTGEVRWSHPVEEGTRLQVSSHHRQREEAEQMLQGLLAEKPELDVNLQQRVSLPAGEAWHIHGTTSRREVDIYLLASGTRRYAISLWTAPGNQSKYDKMLEEIVQSFKVLQQQQDDKETS